MTDIRPAAKPLKQLLSESRERIYRELKARDFDRYTRAIQAAEAVTLTFGLSNSIAVEIESAVVLSVADALGIKGTRSL